jgi:putative ABC transport system permease protein
MNSSLSDLRLALRGLRRSPLFASVAILSLAIGIGANTAIFTLIDQILLRKLPIAAPSSWSWSTSRPRTWAATWGRG